MVQGAIVTVNEQFAVFFAVSVAVQVTVVVPTGKQVLGGGLQSTVTPGQLSEPPGGVYALLTQVLLAMVMFAGQLIVGFCVSLTVTVNEQPAVKPAASLTEQLTVVVPFRKVEPLGGLQVGAPTPEQLSETMIAG